MDPESAHADPVQHGGRLAHRFPRLRAAPEGEEGLQVTAIMNEGLTPQS